MEPGKSGKSEPQVRTGKSGEPLPQVGHEKHRFSLTSLWRYAAPFHPGYAEPRGFFYFCGSLGSHISQEQGYLVKNREETKELHKKVNYLSKNSRIQEDSQEELHYYFRKTSLSVD